MPAAAIAAGLTQIALRTGKLGPRDVPVDIIVRNGEVIALNTRSLLALRRAGIPLRRIHFRNRTGDPEFERRLDTQLKNNRLQAGTDTSGLRGLAAEQAALSDRRTIVNRPKILHDLGVGQMPIVGVRFMTVGGDAMLAYEYDYDIPSNQIDRSSDAKPYGDYQPPAISIICFKGVSAYCKLSESLMPPIVAYNKLVEIEESRWISHFEKIVKKHDTRWSGGRHFRVVFSDSGCAFDIIAESVSAPFPGIPPVPEPDWSDEQTLGSYRPPDPYE